jgi:D-3-phosphoglycerate dehydrogenase
MLALIQEHGGFDGLLNGDDEITGAVIQAGLAAPTKLQVVSKYGIGLDSIDVGTCTANGLPVLFTPGVNHTTVAEHAIALMIACAKHFWTHLDAVKGGGWKRKTGVELAGKVPTYLTTRSPILLLYFGLTYLPTYLPTYFPTYPPTSL